jgi:hypothetical protein
MVKDKESKFLLLFMIGLVIFFLAFIFLELNLKEETGFTEVYLSENETSVKVDEPLKVEFIIHSHEITARQYSYRVSGEQTVQGSLELLPGEKKLVEESLIFSQAGPNQRVFIEVELQNNEAFTLWYWVNVQ